MTHLTNIVKKELRELLTPGSIVSVLVMVMLFAGLGGLIEMCIRDSSQVEE